MILTEEDSGNEKIPYVPSPVVAYGVKLAEARSIGKGAPNIGGTIGGGVGGCAGGVSRALGRVSLWLFLAPWAK